MLQDYERERHTLLSIVPLPIATTNICTKAGS